jgi:Nitroreductase
MIETNSSESSITTNQTDSGTVNLLLSRRSSTAADMVAPGPDAEQLQTILAAGHRVPDHGKIGPWRFVIFEGEARTKFGQMVAAIFAVKNPEASEKLLEFESQRFNRAPLVIAVISSPVDHPKVPQWEQLLSAGACCQNMLVAATAMGFGAQWLTEWYAYDDDVNNALNLNANEKIAGFLYFGSRTKPADERVRPDLAERVRHF